MVLVLSNEILYHTFIMLNVQARGSVAVTKMLWVAALSLTLLAAGCGGSGDSDVVPAPTTAGSQQLRMDSSAVDMQLLIDHENKMISNNAKPLQVAFDNNDYAKAIQALMAMVSVRDVDSETQSNISKALRQVRDSATAAAATGDANAQYALDRLDEMFGN